MRRVFQTEANTLGLQGAASAVSHTLFIIITALFIFFNSALTLGQGMAINTSASSAAASSMLDVASTSKGVLVPRMTTAQRNAISSPATGLLVFQTDGTAGFYYYSGSVWTTVGSILPSGSNGQVLQLSGGAPTWVGTALTVGTSYGGGIIAYILQPGDPGYSAYEQHGLIAATSDQGTSIGWGCSGISYGAYGFLLGTGYNNTNVIVNDCGVSGIAADLCRSYTGGGYTDWHLPSKDELNKLYINRVVLGGFTTANYWSSTEYNIADAWYQAFSGGASGANSKNMPNNVRAVRDF